MFLRRMLKWIVAPWLLWKSQIWHWTVQSLARYIGCILLTIPNITSLAFSYDRQLYLVEGSHVQMMLDLDDAQPTQRQKTGEGLQVTHTVFRNSLCKELHNCELEFVYLLTLLIDVFNMIQSINSRSYCYNGDSWKTVVDEQSDCRLQCHGWIIQPKSADQSSKLLRTSNISGLPCLPTMAQ